MMLEGKRKTSGKHGGGLRTLAVSAAPDAELAASPAAAMRHPGMRDAALCAPPINTNEVSRASEMKTTTTALSIA